MRILAILSVSALVLGAPVFTDQIGMTDLSTAEAKGNGNGGGNGGGNRGGGNGGGKGGKGADKGGKSDKADRAASKGGKGAKAGKGKNPLKSLFRANKQKKQTTRATAQRTAKPKQVTKSAKRQATAQAPNKSIRPASIPARSKPVAAQLKGLNSLNRNINGLMNSSDPKMDGFRDFVRASASLAAAQEALDAANGDLAPLSEQLAETLAELGLDAPTTPEEAKALAAELDAIAGAAAPVEDDFLSEDGTLDQEAFDTAVSDFEASVAAAETAQSELGAVTEALDAVETAEAEVAAGEEATSDIALTGAIVDGLNATGAGPITEADVTPEMFDRVSELLGVGDADGLIDDFIAQEADEATGLEDTPEEDTADLDETPDADDLDEPIEEAGLIETEVDPT